MSSPGGAAGAVIGAIIGTIIFPGVGTTIGAGIGGFVGSLIDPPKGVLRKAKFEEEQIQFNTFDHDLPVPILFGRQKWAPNVIFIGDTYSQVETVGSQPSSSGGKGSETQNIERLIYYADFAIGLCEGPIQRVNAVFKEREDISGQEGSFFTIALGEDDETVPEIVTGSPRPVTLPVPWRHTAKLLFSGRLGEANRIPRILVDTTGPDLTITETGTVTSGPATVSKFHHDDLTDLLTLVTGNYTIVTCDRHGANQQTAQVPNNAAHVIEIAAYDGRTATLLAISTKDVNNLRRIMRGDRYFTDSDDWEVTVGTAEAFQYGIEGFTADEATATLWTAHNSAVTGITLVGTSWKDGTQKTIEVPTDDSIGVNLRAVWFDKPWRRFYVLYSADATLKLLRFNPEDPADVESMIVAYGHADPIGVCRIGELITIFDRSTSQPIHQFEWGRQVDRFQRGTLNAALDFRLRAVPGLTFYFGADSMNGVANGGSIAQWNDDSALQHHATQATAAEQPRFVSSVGGFYNRPAVEFDGVDDDFDTFGNGAVLPTAQGCTIFLVVRPISGGGSQGKAIFSMRNTPSPTPPNNTIYRVDLLYGNMLVSNSATGVAILRSNMVGIAAQGGVAPVGCSVTPGECAIVAIRFKQGEAKIWKNGTLVATYTATTGFGPLSLATHSVFALGRVVTSPGVPTETGHANVQLGEIAIYDRAIADAEVTAVNDFLRARYRIAWGPSYGTYVGVGAKLTYGNPQQFWYADGLCRMMVLDRQTAGTWAVYHSHWNGDGWSILRQDSYSHVMFDEEGSAGGACYTFLTSERYGAGVPTGFVKRYTFERTSGYCNSPSDTRYYQPDQVEYGPKYQVNYLLAARRNLSSCLQEMATCFNGYFVYSEGRLELHADRDLGYIDGHFDENSIVEGSFGFQEMGREDRWNEVIVECFDMRNDYRKVPVPAIAEWERDIYGEARRRTISAFGVTRLRQAGNLAWASLLSYTTRRFACQFSTAGFGLHNTVGDIIGITRSELGWVDKLFRIVQISETETEDLRFSCIEHIPRIAESTGFPLQQPQRVDDLVYGGTSGANSNFQPVVEGVRTRTIENTLTGEIWLFTSQPDNSGPWSTMRWHALWNSSPTPNATFYPGAIPLVTTAYTQVVNTSHFTPSGMLRDTITSSGTTLNLIGICGTPPETAFDVVIYNDAITSVQFNNAHGNGKYERCQGSAYSLANKTVTVQARGVGTTALAHSVVAVAVAAMYTRLAADTGQEEPLGVGQLPPTTGTNAAQLQPVPIYYLGQTIPGIVQGSHPLQTPSDEWYIGFSSTAFVAGTPTGVNNIRVTVTSSQNLAGAAQDYKPTFEYSTGNGSWATLPVEKDETLGFRQSGAICFKRPTDWATSDRWKPSGTNGTQFFPLYNNTGAAAARYYIRIKRGNTASVGGATAPGGGSAANGGQAPREITLENASTMLARGYFSPTVYFLVANATPVYDFLGGAEQGFGLKFKAQPVGVHNQSLQLESIQENSHTILNLAGE